MKAKVLMIMLVGMGYFICPLINGQERSREGSKKYEKIDNFTKLLESLIITKYKSEDYFENLFKVSRWDWQKEEFLVASFIDIEIVVVPRSFSVTYKSYKYNDGMVLPIEEYNVILEEYSNAKIIYSNDDSLLPMDVVRNDFKNYFDLNYSVKISPNHIHPLTEKSRDILKRATIEHKLVKLRGTLFFSLKGKTIEKIKERWSKNGFEFWLDEVVEVE